MTFYPFGKSVVIKPSEPTAHKGLIHYVDEKNPRRLGDIVAIGDEVTTVSVGDKVCYFVSGKIERDDLHYILEEKIEYIMGVKIVPLHDRVLIKPAPVEDVTAGGIIIPDVAKEKPLRGTVFAAGAGKKDEPVTVKEGDVVLYGKYAGTEIQIDGELYLIMRESDILAIL
jgi:chaperonin GroES